MNQGKIDAAVRRAYNNFDEWNDVSGAITKHTGAYYEALACIEDAVHCGIQETLGINEPLPNQEKVKD